MLASQEILDLKTESDNSVKKIHDLLDKFNGYKDRVQADRTRSAQYMSEQIANEQKRLMPLVEAEFAKITAAVKQVAPHKELWASKPLLLSLQKFSEVLANDAQVRAAHHAELSTVPVHILNMILKNAQIDNDLALIYQCFLQYGRNEAKDLGFCDSVDKVLDGLEIPGQKETLTAIRQIEMNEDIALVSYRALQGVALTPLQKLEVGLRLGDHIKPGVYRDGKAL